MKHMSWLKTGGRPEVYDYFLLSFLYWVGEQVYSRHEKYVSTTGSPMYYTARIAKKKHPDAKIVFVGPCVPSVKKHNVMKLWIL